MTPLDFSRWYEFDERSIRGDYYPSAPLEVEEGEKIGVVLMNLGGPRALDDVEPFLYNLLMDPALLDLPVEGRPRHWFAQLLSSYQADSVRDEYELIGGQSPLNRLTNEQADSLEEHLNDRYGGPTGVEFRTYTAMRYWHPFSEEAASRMAEDDIDRVVLLPLYPQYSKATSGSSLAYWKALDEAGDIPSWPTTTAFEYAANPKYVQALSERIDEGLQRFQRDRREEVQLVFSAHGVPLLDGRRRMDPYCCLVHSTVEKVMQLRGNDRPYHTAFQNRIGIRKGLAPSLPDVVDRVAEQEAGSLLVVPLTLVTDHLQTSYGLDIEVREQAEMAGITHYEVTSGLNTHPLFIEALGEVALAQLNMPVDVNQLRIGGDGVSQDYPLRPLEDMPRHPVDTARCSSCGKRLSARRWTAPENAPGSDVVPGTKQDPPRPSASERSS